MLFVIPEFVQTKFKFDFLRIYIDVVFCPGQKKRVNKLVIWVQKSSLQIES